MVLIAKKMKICLMYYIILDFIRFIGKKEEGDMLPVLLRFFKEVLANENRYKIVNQNSVDDIINFCGTATADSIFNRSSC